MRRHVPCGVLLFAAAACADLFAPPLRIATLSIVPVTADGAVLVSHADQLRIRLERDSAGTFRLVKDATVALDAETGGAEANIQVALITSPQQFRILLEAVRSSDGAVLFSGVDTVSVSEQAPGQQPAATEVTVTYSGPVAARVEIAPKDTTLTQGAVVQFRATAYDAEGSAINVPLSFEVPDPTHATMISVTRLGGVVTATQAVTEVAALLVVSTFDEVPKRDTARVYVCSPSVVGPVRALSVSPATHTFTLLGETLQQRATGTDACANQIPDPPVTWSSSAPDIIPVGSDGVARARDNGSATVTATLVADPTVVASAELTATIPQGDLRGVVSRQEDGSPVEGMEMILTGVFGRARRATSDAAGVYLFTGLLAGAGYTLGVNTETLPPITVLVSDASRTVDVAGNVTTDAPATVIRKANVPVTAAVSATSVAVDGEIEVTLSVDMTEVGPGLGAVTARIRWADAMLRYVAGSFTAVAGWDAIVANSAVPGELTLSAGSAQGVGDDVVVVARFKLRAKAAGTTDVSVSATDLSTIDAAGVSYDLFERGNVTFTGEQVTVGS